MACSVPLKWAVGVAAFLAFAALPARAGASSPPTQTATTAAFVPPVPTSSITVAYPSGANIDGPAVVQVLLRIDEHGAVTRVELLKSAGRVLDEAVLHGATHFTFRPATEGGVPVEVDIPFSQRFLPPPEPQPRTQEARPPRYGVLAGQLTARGTGRPVPHAVVNAWIDDVRLHTTSDERGAFELELPTGTATIAVEYGAPRLFIQRERIAPDRRIEVRYLVEPTFDNPYDVLVEGDRDRTVISRTRLRGRDLKQVPGTLGDPFRVVASLPGVSSVSSLLPFPVVRGSSPGNTGFLIDGVRVPLLFHLLAGPSVVHPEFIDEIDFSPGGFPADYGGYVGGIVDGRTRVLRTDRVELQSDLNLFQAGALAKVPLLGGTFTGAGRLGYPGLLIGLVDSEVGLSYWDYQARYDGGDRRLGYSVFVFGASDTLETVPFGSADRTQRAPFLSFEFHRLDLQLRHRTEALQGRHQITVGYEDSLTGGDATLSNIQVFARSRLAYRATSAIELRLGLDGQVRFANFEETGEGIDIIQDLLGSGQEPSDVLLTGGGLFEAIVNPLERLSIRLGLRVDVYHDTQTAQAAVDPRFAARYRLLESATLGPDSGLWIKGTIGLYHQPPRFTIPIPALDAIAFEQGLLESLQTSVGAELKLGRHWTIDGTAYFNWMDPILYDLQVNTPEDDIGNQPPQAPPGQAPPETPTNNDYLGRLDQLLQPATGRAYGLELLIRRRAERGVSGWISYTFSRAERLQPEAWRAFDFDRTHLLNGVFSLALPRSWQLGLRMQLATGRPLTTTEGLPNTRNDTFVRFDVRVDRTVIYNRWILNFYIDISNALLATEEVTPDQNLRYILPTLGVRAFF